MASTPENLIDVAPQQKQPEVDVLDTIKTGGKKPKEMNSFEVIQDALSRAVQNPQEVEKLTKKLAVMIKDPKNKLVQIGNSVFLMMLKDPETVEFHTFSAETPENLIKNYVGAAQLLKSQGVKRAITYADSPGYVEIAKKTGLPVKVSQSTKVIGGVAKPVYLFELEL